MSTLSTRQALLRTAYRALADSDLDVSRAWLRVGWLMVDDDAPEISAQRRESASFEWIAVGYSPISFFDLHAGLVVCEGGQVSAGVHAHRRSAAARLLAQSEAQALQYVFAEAVKEEQYNMPRNDIDEGDQGIFVTRFASCLAILRSVAERMGS